MALSRSFQTGVIVSVALIAGAFILWQIARASGDLDAQNDVMSGPLPDWPIPPEVVGPNGSPPKSVRLSWQDSLSLQLDRDGKIPWEGDHFPLRVEIDADLRVGSEACEIRPQSWNLPDQWELQDDGKPRLSQCSTLPNGDLRIRIGRSDQFGGTVIELRLAVQKDDAIRADVGMYSYRKAGPPSFAATDLSGRIILNPARWKTGSEVQVMYELAGDIQGRWFQMRQELRVIAP